MSGDVADFSLTAFLFGVLSFLVALDFAAERMPSAETSESS